VISERFVERYCKTYFTDGTVVIGYIMDAEMRGAAELHPPDQQGSSSEIAFSVEKIVRSQGVGSILFERVIYEAQKRGYDSLNITTNVHNERMKALARKFSVRMESRNGETSGILKIQRGPTGKTNGSLSKAA
jgi:GNAT superfamily N-acetyltransferase